MDIIMDEINNNKSLKILLINQKYFLRFKLTL